ncbi:MAG: hypothetical protein OXU88_01265, partial [Gammaproteobacteria bacterium]|nr:hypothetical protein [Gammaproteobacteria bacterium]
VAGRRDNACLHDHAIRSIVQVKFHKIALIFANMNRDGRRNDGHRAAAAVAPTREINTVTHPAVPRMDLTQ